MKKLKSSKQNRFLLLLAAIFFVALCSWMPGGGLWDDATYPGGKEAVEKYMTDSMRYPEAEKKAGKEELIVVSFDISSKGVAQNPRITSLLNSSDGFNKEVERLVAGMPAWEPAKDKKGKPTVGSDYAFVRFELPDSLLDLPPASEDTSLIKDFTKLKVDTFAHYPGSEYAFHRYLQSTIRYPRMEKEMGKDGTVYIYFIIEQNGKVTNVKCVKGVPGAPGLEKEAMRVISNMPRWAPTMVEGKAMRSSMTVPVRFTLQ